MYTEIKLKRNGGFTGGAMAYIEGMPSGLQQPPQYVSKNLKIILNVCYILMVLNAYLKIIL
jgi:hypothetical protein